MVIPAQIFLFIVIAVLTTIISLCGLQVFNLLKELRQSIQKANKILDDAGLISESLAKPISGISGFLAGLKSGAEIIKLLRRKKEETE